jgi:hypothetical protein
MVGVGVLFGFGHGLGVALAGAELGSSAAFMNRDAQPALERIPAVEPASGAPPAE